MGFIDNYINTLRECGREDDANKIEEEEYGIFRNKENSFKDHLINSKKYIKEGK